MTETADPNDKATDIVERPQDDDYMPELLENFALEWEADIRFNKMSDGSEPGPEVKILPREQCSRETTEARIAFVRSVAATITDLRQQLAEAREALAPFAACCFADNGDVTINSARLCSGDFLRAAMLTTFEQRENQRALKDKDAQR